MTYICFRLLTSYGTSVPPFIIHTYQVCICIGPTIYFIHPSDDDILYLLVRLLFSKANLRQIYEEFAQQELFDPIYRRVNAVMDS